jgi:hypothetical protein
MNFLIRIILDFAKLPDCEKEDAHKIASKALGRGNLFLPSVLN